MMISNTGRSLAAGLLIMAAIVSLIVVKTSTATMNAFHREQNRASGAAVKTGTAQMDLNGPMGRSAGMGASPVSSFRIQERAERPFGSSGIDDGVAEYLGIDRKQVVAINQVAHDVRLKIMKRISDNLEEVGDPASGKRMFVYRGSAAFFDAIANDLETRLTSTVNESYAKSSLPALTASAEFLQGGRDDMSISITPPENSKDAGRSRVKIEFMDKAGKVFSAYEMDLSVVKDKLWLDFDR